LMPKPARQKEEPVQSMYVFQCKVQIYCSTGKMMIGPLIQLE
jgi:hypothetical protein